MTARRVSTNGEITVARITFGRFVNDNGNKGGRGRKERRWRRKSHARAEKERERERAFATSTPFHFLELDGAFQLTQRRAILRNASLNLPHKTLIVD